MCSSTRREAADAGISSRCPLICSVDILFGANLGSVRLPTTRTFTAQACRHGDSQLPEPERRRSSPNREGTVSMDLHIDMRAGYSLRVESRELSVDAYNLTNANTVSPFGRVRADQHQSQR
jgi:hypothetical protein